MCYSKLNCFKCKQIHVKNKSIMTHVICSLCKNSFDSEFCLKSHYEKSITIGMKNVVLMLDFIILMQKEKKNA